MQRDACMETYISSILVSFPQKDTHACVGMAPVKMIIQLFFTVRSRERERAAHINEPSGDEATTIEG